jgi:lipoprotein signal peptidase
MARCAVALAGTAMVLAALDLAHKAGSDTAYVHSRSPSYVVFVVALATIWTAAILVTRSLSIAVGGGVLAGGAAGNLVSLAVWPGVPNPIVLGPIAFNLADVFVLCGFVLVAAAVLVLAGTNRERLREPIRLR